MIYTNSYLTLKSNVKLVKNHTLGEVKKITWFWSFDFQKVMRARYLFLFSYFFLNTNNHGNPFSRFLDINNNPPSGYLSTHEYYSRLNGSRKKVIETKKNDNSLQLKQVISQNNMNNYSINIIPSNSLFQESHTTTTP